MEQKEARAGGCEVELDGSARIHTRSIDWLSTSSVVVVVVVVLLVAVVTTKEPTRRRHLITTDRFSAIWFRWRF